MQPTLKQEGITPEFLKSFTMDQEYSPVQLQPNEEPVKLIRCSAGYWVMLEFGVYLKDEKRRLVVIPEKEAKIGRARYLLAFKDQIASNAGKIYEAKIQEEICRLKSQVDVRVKEDLAKMREILVLGGKIEVTGMEAILMSVIEDASGDDPFSFNGRDKLKLQQRKALAKELATDEFVNAYESLQRLSEAGEYNTLYQHYFQDGLPLLASFTTTNAEHQAALVKNFHKDKIMATIEEIQSKDHLYMVAKFNVDKRGAR
jgi:hypothetical protein